MPDSLEIVITGAGAVSPIGIGAEAYWQSLIEGRSGVRDLRLLQGEGLPPTFGGDVADFDPKRFVRPRKSLKVMSRDIQMAFAAADLACDEAASGPGACDPERLGVVFGAEIIPCELDELEMAYRRCMVDGRFDFTRWGTEAIDEMFPLWMLKYLPNMPACHIGISRDARGPNNSITLGEVSSLAAVAEAVRVIQRDHAEMMIAGGTASHVVPSLWARNQTHENSRRADDPAAACRPFDADRDGMVHGEGAAAFVLEKRTHAEHRGAPILARVLGFAATFEPIASRGRPQGKAIRAAIRAVLKQAKLQPGDVGHVNAHGVATRYDDAMEARAIRDELGQVPVTAPKSYFGNLGAGTGAVEMVASVLALRHGLIPPTLNYRRPDPDCPVCVVKGEPIPARRPTALVLNHTLNGQAVALLIGAVD